MDANDAQLEYATLYASAKNGWAVNDMDKHATVRLSLSLSLSPPSLSLSLSLCVSLHADDDFRNPKSLNGIKSPISC